MKTIEMTTLGMYSLYIGGIKTIMWENGEVADDLVCNLKALVYENMDGIRKMFKDGYTMFLTYAEDMEDIEKCIRVGEPVEIRVYNSEDVLIGVVIQSEIVF